MLCSFLSAFLRGSGRRNFDKRCSWPRLGQKRRRTHSFECRTIVPKLISVPTQRLDFAIARRLGQSPLSLEQGSQTRAIALEPRPSSKGRRLGQSPLSLDPCHGEPAGMTVGRPDRCHSVMFIRAMSLMRRSRIVVTVLCSFGPYPWCAEVVLADGF